ncbi:MAG: ASCH domain-containing protein [Candidatus Niyogibacteria bacterium]|nr:MAG: ASCH domain-containing protein [Candidatus Niyogibacteria bacterium]
MKTLKFRHNLVQKVLDGSKTVTWRLFDDKNIQVGDQIELIDWESGGKFAEAKITGVREKKLGEIEEKDFEGHEKYQSNEEMLEHYKKYYEEKVDMNTEVKIIDFKLLRDSQ